MFRHRHWIPVLLSAALGCHGTEPVAAPTAKVVAVTVHAKPLAPITRRSAVASGARLRLGFDVPGVLAMVAVKTGDTVSEGQLLARLRDGDVSASVAAAHATRTRALRDFKAAKVLAASGAVGTGQREDAHSNLRLATANTSLAELTLDKRKLVSPVAGTVLRRIGEPGETLTPGSTVLLVEDSRLIVSTGLNDRNVARVRIGQPVTIIVDHTDGRASGTVTSVAPAPAEDGLYAVEIALGAEAKLRPGTLVTARFDDERAPAALRAPLDAIVYRNDKSWVFVLDATATKSPARLQAVALGDPDGDQIVVRDGLKEGDRVVGEGAQFLQDGQMVGVVTP